MSMLTVVAEAPMAASGHGVGISPMVKSSVDQQICHMATSLESPVTSQVMTH